MLVTRDIRVFQNNRLQIGDLAHSNSWTYDSFKPKYEILRPQGGEGRVKKTSLAHMIGVEDRIKKYCS